MLALFATFAVFDQRWTEAMLWLFAALVVDGVDGSLARAARVKELAGRVDGDALDLVIDYLNYVFVPSLFMIQAGLLPPAFALLLAALIQLSSLYVFARRDMKTADNYFRGFPALWNIVALYIFAAGVGPAAAAIIVLVLVALTFAPVHVVHPFRVRDFGWWLPALSLLWALSTLALLFQIPDEMRQPLFIASSASAIVLVGMGLLRTVHGDLRLRQSPQRPQDGNGAAGED
ncbi:MAG TPA: CDP-alcohol phosphatidyltransferase family protein [Sphingomicrobium sp.]